MTKSRHAIPVIFFVDNSRKNGNFFLDKLIPVRYNKEKYLKKRYIEMKKFLLTVLMIPGLFLFGIFLIFYLPVDFFRYCFSPLRKDKRFQYRPFLLLSAGYTFYKAVQKEKLPVEFFPAKGSFGYFLYRNFLIIADFATPITYDNKTGFWHRLTEEGQAPADISPEIEAIKEEFLTLYPEEKPQNKLTVRLCVDKKEFLSEEDLRQAENNPLFLLHNGKNIAEVINSLAD